MTRTPGATRVARGRGRHSAQAPPGGGAPGPLVAALSGGGASLIAALLVLCVAALVGIGALYQHHRQVQTTDRARTQALRAARTAAEDILSYDYRSVEAAIRQARADTTGVFRTEYDTTAKILLPQAKQLKAIVQATVGSAAVMSATTSHVQVLLFVDQATVKQVPGEKTPTTRIDQSRVRMTMTHVHGQWLVSELSAL